MDKVPGPSKLQLAFRLELRVTVCLGSIVVFEGEITMDGAQVRDFGLDVRFMSEPSNLTLT